MNKKVIRILAIILAILLVLGSLATVTVSLAEEETNDNTQYEMHMSLLEDEQSLLVNQQVTFTNETGRELPYVMFQLFANVLRRQTTVPFEEEELDSAYPNGFAPGGIDFVSVRVNGLECEWGVQGDAECFLRVGHAMQPGEQVRFQFVYYLLLPEVQGFLGVGELGWRLNAFYPAVCVFDPSTDDFETGAMSAVCDSLHTEMSDYIVTLELPEEYQVACFGLPENIDQQNGRISWRIEAENVREIALLLSKKYKVYERESEQGVLLRMLCDSSSAADDLMDTAQDALELFGQWFGEYPYPVLTIAQGECLTQGDSASGVISLDDSLFGWKQREELRAELVRQLARQWFGGQVTANPVREPWLQDTLCEYAQLMYVEHTQGRQEYLKQLNAQAIPSLEVTIPGGLTVDSAADRFTTRYEYETVVLDRGIAVLHELRELMGAETFLDALRLYVEENACEIASIGDFAAALNRAAGGRWDEYLVGQLQTISDYSGHDVPEYE